MNDLIFLPYEDRHCEELPVLFKESFGVQLQEGYFDWKFKANPAGVPIAFIARDKFTDELAGYYGVIPELFYIEHKPVLMYQSCDTMTHSGFRRRGIFESLAKLTYKALAEKNNLLLYGFAGGMSYPGFVNKLGWCSVERLGPWFLPAPVMWLRQTLFNQSRKEFRIEESTSYHPEMSTLDQHLKSTAKISICRSREFLDWRLTQPGHKPFYVYVFLPDNLLAGLLILRQESSGLMLIMDMAFRNDLASSSELPAFMLGLAEGFALKYHAKGLYTWSNSNSCLSKCLRKALFLKNPFERGPLRSNNHFILLENGDKASSDLIRNDKNWQLTPLYYDA